MRGVPLTPEQIATAAAEYARTGSYEAAGKAANADPSAIRRRLIAASEPDRAARHAAACERGLRDGRKQLNDMAALVYHVAYTENRSGASLEPKDLASLANSLVRLNEARVHIADREDRRRTARLTRARTRVDTQRISAEVEALKKDPSGLLAKLILPAVLFGRHDPPAPVGDHVPAEPETE